MATDKGLGTTTADKESAIKWQRLLNTGERELAQTFRAQELEEVVEIIVQQAKADRLNYRDFWGLSIGRLGEIVRMYKENLAEKMVRLGELAGIALKERVGGVIAFTPGAGGRPKRQ